MDLFMLDYEAIYEEGLQRLLTLGIQERHGLAFALAFIASMGTFIGGLLVVVLLACFKKGSKRNDGEPLGSTLPLMGILQAFSGGVMLYITCFDLVPEAIEQLGQRQTMTWFFTGVFVFGILEIYVIPHEHEHGEGEAKDHTRLPEAPSMAPDTPSKRSTRSSTASRSRSKSPSKRELSPSKKPVSAASKKERAKMLRTSLITFLAMGLHNLPEGLGVYLSTLANTRLGLQLAIGIMLHNIPEGMAVAIPLYGATRSYSSVLFWTLVNGMAEPLGVVIGGALLHQYISQALLSRCLAMVGGIMICISMQYVSSYIYAMLTHSHDTQSELQPMAIKYAGKTRASLSFFAGMVACFGALDAVSSWFDQHHHHH